MKRDIADGIMKRICEGICEYVYLHNGRSYHQYVTTAEKRAYLMIEVAASEKRAYLMINSNAVIFTGIGYDTMRKHKARHLLADPELITKCRTFLRFSICRDDHG